MSRSSISDLFGSLVFNEADSSFGVDIYGNNTEDKHYENGKEGKRKDLK